MKKLNILMAASAALLLTACADTDVPGFNFSEPEALKSQAVLDAYGPLKSYVNRTNSPIFKMGGATTASTFNELGQVYALDLDNYEELVTGNAFKYASVVADDGSMDFSTVSKFVENATAAGLSVYGHTLVWHSQQNVKYLQKLMADIQTGDGPAVEAWTDVKVTTYSDGKFPFYPMGCEPPVIDGSLHFVPTGAWSQFFCSTGNSLTEGDYRAVFHVCASEDVNVNMVAQNGWASTDQNIASNVLLKKGWNDIIFTMSGVLGGNYDLIMKPGTGAATIDLNSITIQKRELLNKRAQTDEEKKDTLTFAMKSWIDGMMKACNGKVKAWDLVNEPMSDAAPTELKSAAREGNTESNFYWQDYLGKDYARLACKLARQAASDSVQLKLFINDYNLEAAYNNNAKCEGLIKMIKYWESDGVTKIDGIGSQMHVTYSMNAKKQEENQKAYVRHLELLAATGKLIRLSELDMGIEDENGNTIHTADVTPEQHQAMANYYKFIVEQYLKIIPPAQQYGITNWGVTDSPKNSGWRADEPIGLWDANYNRKPAYKGFADGLAGK